MKMKNILYIAPVTTVHVTAPVTILAGTTHEESTKNVVEVENAELGINQVNLWDEDNE